MSIVSSSEIILLIVSIVYILMVVVMDKLLFLILGEMGVIIAILTWVKPGIEFSIFILLILACVFIGSG